MQRRYGRKSRAAVNRERQAVLDSLRGAPDGLNLEAAYQAYELRVGSSIPYNTLRLRLRELESSGFIVRTAKRNPRYMVLATRRVQPEERVPAIATLREDLERRGVRTQDRNASAPSPSEETDGTKYAILLSEDARRALGRIALPRNERMPVTYRPAFLDTYVPGENWYLPADLREELRRIGTTAYAGQPAGTYARDIMERLIIDLSWGSSRLEGNKYSRIDTEELFKGGVAAEGASPVDRQMILNHKAAIEFMVENAQEIDFDRPTILGLHALLSENLLGNADEEGRLRTRPVSIGTSVYTPTAIPQLIEAQFDKILARAKAIPDPLEQAFFMMVHIPYLQPFLDVNKRTSRLAANISLIKANLCPLSFVDVPERMYTEGVLAIYEMNDVTLLRDVFAWAYRRSCDQFRVIREAMGTPDPIRLNYRQQLRGVVSDVVEAGVWPDHADLRARAETYDVPENDREAFASAAGRDLLALRLETLSRYRLRPSQFNTWIAAVADARARATS